MEYLLTHRGVTHSVLLLPAWALLYSWILSKVLREPGGWRALYGVTGLALGAHIAGDRRSAAAARRCKASRVAKCIW